jgi:hypothetical protein
VRIVDASSAAPLPPAIPDFNPAIDGIYERAMFEEMRDGYLNALSKLEAREQDVQWLEQRNAYLESSTTPIG